MKVDICVTIDSQLRDLTRIEKLNVSGLLNEVLSKRYHLNVKEVDWFEEKARKGGSHAKRS